MPLGRKIGHGSYGHVYVGVDTVDGTRIAVKCIQDVFRTTEDAKRTLVRPPLVAHTPRVVRMDVQAYAHVCALAHSFLPGCVPGSVSA
eukprot:COSAG01_NODE_41524_length_450_cov_1.313390_1_plen_87_part_10